MLLSIGKTPHKTNLQAIVLYYCLCDECPDFFPIFAYFFLYFNSPNLLCKFCNLNAAESSFASKLCSCSSRKNDCRDWQRAFAAAATPGLLKPDLGSFKGIKPAFFTNEAILCRVRPRANWSYWAAWNSSITPSHLHIPYLALSSTVFFKQQEMQACCEWCQHTVVVFPAWIKVP